LWVLHKILVKKKNTQCFKRIPGGVIFLCHMSITLHNGLTLETDSFVTCQSPYTMASLLKLTFDKTDRTTKACPPSLYVCDVIIILFKEI